MRSPLKLLFLSCILCLFASALVPAGAGAKQYTLTGKTMGTFYSIKFLSMTQPNLAQLHQQVDFRLQEVNDRLSMYNPRSEISLFNRQPALQVFRLSPDFYNVLVQCQHLFRITQGAWDGTVKPLVDLWGFGTQEKPEILPETGRIEQALARTGFHKLELTDHKLTKKETAITLDLGSIAKGYGVDALAQVLKENKIHNFLVEIGGELRGSGKNKNSQAWAVGITRPEKMGVNQDLLKVVYLADMAIATSGNYRNFFEQDGKTFSHIIHPKTGFPVDNQVVSASVIAENCTFADGLATALMVMEVQKSLDLVNSLDRTECLIIQKQGDRFISFRSNGFEAFEQE